MSVSVDNWEKWRLGGTPLARARRCNVLQGRSASLWLLIRNACAGEGRADRSRPYDSETEILGGRRVGPAAGAYRSHLCSSVRLGDPEFLDRRLEPSCRRRPVVGPGPDPPDIRASFCCAAGSAAALGICGKRGRWQRGRIILFATLPRSDPTHTGSQ